MADDAAERALKRLYGDCLAFSPNHVVIMFGMNDIGIDVYFQNYTEANKEELIEKRIQRLKDSLVEIIER